MAIAPSLLSGNSFIRTESLIRNNERLQDLNRQLATGEKATTYGGLGNERVQSISLRQDVSRLEAFNTSIDRVNLRIEVTALSLDRLEDLRIEARSAINPNNFIDLGNGNTFTQELASASLSETFALLNTQSDGRYVFSGNEVKTRPLEDLDVILNGDATRAGLKQVTDERLRADLGASGFGRLNVSIAASTVTLVEDSATDFGFDINNVDNGLSNLTVTGTGTEPASYDFEFTGQPVLGEVFKIALDLPDGTTTAVELEVSNIGNDQNGFKIGATAADTAANFEEALKRQLSFEARTELNAVSRIEAAENFFNTEGGQPPRRLDTPGTPETAIGLVNGTPADTVFYYQGQNDAENPRAGIKTRVDDAIVIDYGLRANETAFRRGIQSLAAFSIGDFTSGTEQENQAIHNAFAKRTQEDLASQVDAPSIQSVTQEIVAFQAIAGNASKRHDAEINLLNGVREEIERADPTVVAAQLLTLQTQIEASYRVSSRIAEASLINFLPA